MDQWLTGQGQNLVLFAEKDKQDRRPARPCSGEGCRTERPRRNGWKQEVVLRHIACMTEPENAASPSASVEEIQQDWSELKLKVEQAAAECSASDVGG